MPSCVAVETILHTHSLLFVQAIRTQLSLTKVTRASRLLTRVVTVCPICKFAETTRASNGKLHKHRRLIFSHCEAVCNVQCRS